MTSRVELPATLAGLQAALARGDFSVGEALAEQHRRCVENDRLWHACVAGTVRQPEVDGPATTLLPLTGAALLHKDVFDTARRRAGCGEAAATRTEAAGQDAIRPTAPVLLALAAAGATYSGALTLAQYACGATAENPAQTRPVNPLDSLAMVGGSSSGSAVAVAGGLCYASLGTDTAGSVRIPAASCGVVGLKTTPGAVSSAGVMPLATSLDTVGVLARSAADAARVYTCAAVASHPRTLASPLPAQTALRLVSAYQDDALDPEVGDALEAFEDALARGRAPGVTLHRAEPSARVHASRRDAWSRRAQVILHAQAGRLHQARLRSQGIDTLPAPMQGVVLPGIALPAAWVESAQRERPAALTEVLSECFGAADALLCPALPIALPDWDVVYTDGARFKVQALLALHRHTAWVNYVGLPAVVFPIGSDSRGRPIGAQLIGRPFQELLLLELLARLEAAGIASQTAWSARPSFDRAVAADLPSFVSPPERPVHRHQE